MSKAMNWGKWSDIEVVMLPEIQLCCQKYSWVQFVNEDIFNSGCRFFWYSTYLEHKVMWQVISYKFTYTRWFCM